MHIYILDLIDGQMDWATQKSIVFVTIIYFDLFFLKEYYNDYDDDDDDGRVENAYINCLT
jgi:hypothetical protein